MTTLIDAIRTKDTTTANGMSSHSTSLNACVDMFFNVGAMRGKSKTNEVVNLFVKAYAEDKLLALKLAFWARDVRGGAGERQIFKDIASYLATSRNKASIKKNIALIPEFGRWDDLLVFIGTELESVALDVIKKGFDNDNTRGLVAKWMPRPTGKNPINRRDANIIRKHLGLSPKAYRKLLVEHSNTVEQAMCAKNWGAIEYSKIPSKAMSDYNKAFQKNDGDRFNAYLALLEKGETKINAGAIYPYDVLKNLKQGNSRGADAQWEALPNFMEGNTERVLPLVDVSSSMTCSAGDSRTLTCMDIAISLGLYIAERNEGPFKDAFITFNTTPTLEVLKGSLSDRYRQMARANWGGSTDLEKAYKLILDKAVRNKVPASEMPTTMIILSDMQFNVAVNGGGWGRSTSWNPTAQEMVKDMFAKAGYELPKIVYWNLHAYGDTPVQFDENGTALVSGFSPSLLTSLLSGGNMTPISMMLDIIDSDRYKEIKA